MANVAQIDLNLFVVLDAIYTEGNVTRASAKLNLTQPAISHALGRLRELFDDPLFVRKGHVMVPTPVARNAIEPVRQALRTLEVTLHDSSRFDPRETQKRLTVTVPGSEEASLLPPLMQRLLQRAPLIDLVLARGDRQQLESRLADGSVDIAIDVLLQHSGNVLHRRVAMQRLVVVARRGHPQVDEQLDLPTYLKQEHILVSSRRQGPGPADVELSRLGLQRHIRLRCTQYLAACHIVSSSDLILTMPEFDALAVNRNFDNRILPLPLDAATLDIYLYWHGTVDNDPANRWLRAQLVEVFEELRGG